MELIRVTKIGLNISSEAEVLAYTYDGANPIEVLARSDVGSTTTPIAGNGSYDVRAYINGNIVSPDITIIVNAGVTKTTFISRPLALESGDLVSIRVLGRPADTAINTISSLRITTPILLSDVDGPGVIPIDQNYGGTDNLAYKTALGVGVSGATILVYLQSDYDAANRGNAFVVAKTTTIVNGSWNNIVMLNPGNYTLIYSVAGLYGPDRADITVLPV